jgi:hypothetical protein
MVIENQRDDHSHNITPVKPQETPANQQRLLTEGFETTMELGSPMHQCCEHRQPELDILHARIRELEEQLATSNKVIQQQKEQMLVLATKNAKLERDLLHIDEFHTNSERILAEKVS